MEKVLIVVKGGMVQSVYGSSKDVDVEVLDLDTEEGIDAEETTERPEFVLW